MSENDFIIPPSRLEALTDGIFAVAMTILVLNIQIPDMALIQHIGIYGYLQNIMPTLLIYFISFILLGSFWLAHNSFFSIKKIDNKVIWINIIYLMFIGLVPFSVGIGAGFDYSVFAEIFFGLNIFIIGMLNFIIIRHAYNQGFLKKESFDDVKKLNLDPLFFFIVPIVAILLSYVNSDLNFLFYLLIPIFILMPSRHFDKTPNLRYWGRKK